MPTRRLLTLHAPLGRLLSDPVLSSLDDALKEHGIKRWWISPEDLPDAVIMAEVPEELAPPEEPPRRDRRRGDRRQ